MPVATTDTAAIRAEKAIAAYLRGSRDANADDATFTGTLTLDCSRAGDLNGVAIHEGRQSQTMETPIVVVDTSQGSKPIQPGESIHELTVQIMLATGHFEGASKTQRQHAEVLHAARSKALNDLICDEATLKIGLNKPPHPQTDARAVDEFHLVQSWIEDQVGDASQSYLSDTWDLVIWCAPWDAVVS